MIGFGSQAFTSCVICAHVIRSFWLRRLSACPQEVAADDPSQPLPLLGDRLVHASPHLLFDLLELRPHAVPPGLPFDLEFVLMSLAADEGEAQEVEGLRLANEVYLPRLRERRISHGRRIEVRPPLFPGYAFIAIELRWHRARWTAGVLGLIMGGIQPARVPDSVIAEIRARERGGAREISHRRGCARHARAV